LVLLLKQQNNNYPMKEWHVEHMQKTIIKYITGFSDSMSSWQAKQYLKFYNIANVQMTIAYDAKHGVSKEEILLFIDLVRSHPTYCDLQSNNLSLGKLNEIEKYVCLHIK
jgi:hypothetical protein